MLYDECLINPYENVNWDTAEHIKSMSHMHLVNQESFERAVKDGYRHFPISNYIPAKPTYPLTDFFRNVPDDVLGAPNSEKAYHLNSGVHYCALGSFAVGHGNNPDRDPVWKDAATVNWQVGFDEVFAALQFPDGGGITLNHPTYPYGIGIDQYIEKLDYDDRVLGIEMYNRCSAGRVDGICTPKFYLDEWDSILKTGRRCWGFAVVDWQMPYDNWGSNILVVPEFTEHECLKAYRNGNFYMQIKDLGLRFKDITLVDGTLSVSVNRESIIKFVTARGVAREFIGKEASFTPDPDENFVRVEAHDRAYSDSAIFSNPIMFRKHRK